MLLPGPFQMLVDKIFVTQRSPQHCDPLFCGGDFGLSPHPSLLQDPSLQLVSANVTHLVDNFFVQLEKSLTLEFIENGKSVLFLDDHITKSKDKITLKSKDAYVDNMLAMLGMGAANRQAHRWCERSLRHTTTRCRDVSVSCGHFDVFEETPFRLALRGKVSGNGEFLADHARDASGIGFRPREQLTELNGVMDRGQTSTKNGS